MMRKFPFFLVLLLFYYIAVMYQSSALMVLFLVLAFLACTMLLLSFYFKKNLTVGFAEKTVFAESGRPFVWRLRVQNRGRLPISRFRIKFKIRLPEKPSGKKKKIYGNGICGESFISESSVLNHCGIIAFQAYGVSVSDYLSLFLRKKKIESSMEAIVLPRKYEMRIETDSFPYVGEESSWENPFYPGADYGEIRQIREYRDGDSIRYIHWNQTARSEELWVKEYSQEAEAQVCLFLDLTADRKLSVADTDAFYTLLYSMVWGFLRDLPSVRIFWKEAGQSLLSNMEVRDGDQCRELLFRLYRAGFSVKEEQDVQAEITPDEGIMKLSADLRWSAGGRLLFHFSKDNLEKELRQRIFKL